MNRTDEEFAADILAAAKQLEQIVELGRESFDDSWILIRAAERLLEVIGVAADHLSEGFLRSVPELPVREAKDMRNLISHEYFKTDIDIVWRVITRDVPEFAATLGAKVSASDNPSDAGSLLPTIESLAAALPPLNPAVQLQDRATGPREDQRTDS